MFGESIFLFFLNPQWRICLLFWERQEVGWGRERERERQRDRERDRLVASCIRSTGDQTRNLLVHRTMLNQLSQKARVEIYFLKTKWYIHFLIGNCATDSRGVGISTICGAYWLRWTNILRFVWELKIVPIDSFKVPIRNTFSKPQRKVFSCLGKSNIKCVIFQVDEISFYKYKLIPPAPKITSFCLSSFFSFYFTITSKWNAFLDSCFVDCDCWCFQVVTAIFPNNLLDCTWILRALKYTGLYLRSNWCEI